MEMAVVCQGEVEAVNGRRGREGDEEEEENGDEESENTHARRFHPWFCVEKSNWLIKREIVEHNQQPIQS